MDGFPDPTRDGTSSESSEHPPASPASLEKSGLWSQTSQTGLPSLPIVPEYVLCQVAEQTPSYPNSCYPSF